MCRKLMCLVFFVVLLGIVSHSYAELLLHYGLDETSGGTAADSTGGNDGSVTGGTWATPGAMPQTGPGHLVLSTGHITVANLPSSVGDLTVMSWLNKSGGPRFPWLVGTIGGGGNLQICIEEDGNPGQVEVGCGGGWEIATTSFSSGSWVHLAFVREAASGAVKMYLDGNLEHTFSCGAGNVDLSTLMIGKSPAFADRYLNGGYDDFAILDEALDEAAINNCMSNGVGSLLGTKITFESAASENSESVSLAELAVVVKYPKEGESYSVDYAAVGGTATGGGVDYILEPGTLTFNAGQTTRTIGIDIAHDGEDEEDETIVVELSNASGVDVELGDIVQHTYTILDPRPAVAFDEDSGTNREDVSPVDITVSLSFASDETVTVDYAATGGMATGGGVDYTLEAGTLTFNAGETTKTISLAIVNDGVDEQNETIVITLSNPGNAKLGDIAEYTYTIIDPSVLHLKVDLALPQWDAREEPWPGTAKEGWWPWVAGRWADMYAHDCVWEHDGQVPEGIDGTGVHAMLSMGYEGQAGLHAKDLCRCNLAGDCAPSGSIVGDPIANTWLYAVDWAGPHGGDIVLIFTDLPPGQYELKSYHNWWEPGPGQGSRNCLRCEKTQPPMPSITANPLPVNTGDGCKPPGKDHYRGLCVCGTGTGVTAIENSYDVPVTHVYSDDAVATSTILFETDGSEVLIIYEAPDWGYPDCARGGREGGRGILNAFELKLMSASGCACLGDVSDTGGFGEPDGKVDIGDINALLFAMLGAYPEGDPTGLYEIDAAGLPCGADVSDTGGFGGPDGKVDIGDLNAMLFTMLGAYPDGDPSGLYEVPCL